MLTEDHEFLQAYKSLIVTVDKHYRRGFPYMVYGRTEPKIAVLKNSFQLTMGALTVVGLALALNSFIIWSAEGAGTCGQRKLAAAALIAHGYKARPGAWPWHGALFHRYRLGRTDYACGVTILAEQYVLTAAHCTYEGGLHSLPANRIFIKVGFSNLDSPEEHVRQFDVDKIIRHEVYDKDTFENDIALLKLSCEITYNSYIQPVCVWQGETQLSKIISKLGFVVGWGLDEGYNLPKHLGEATMLIVPGKICMESDRWHYYKFYFESKTFCAGQLNSAHVSYGDSGGGLFMQMGSNWVLRGFVSNAKMNASTFSIQENSYTIFTDVAYYLNWIKTIVPDIPYFAVDTEQIIETEFDNDANLLDLRNCGKVTYRSGTQDEENQLVNQYPWETLLIADDSKNRIYLIGCVAFFIHPSFVIGLASCFRRSQAVGEIFALIKEFDRIDIFSKGIPIHDTFIHPKFSSEPTANDIGIAKLEQPATVNPICLPLLDPLEHPDATQLHTIGVQLHNETRYFQNVTKLVDLEVCQKQFAETGIQINWTESLACSTLIIKDIDLLYYLVSAPRHHKNKELFDGRYFLAAFSYLLIEGTSSEYFTVFTNVTYYSKWIRETIEKN